MVHPNGDIIENGVDGLNLSEEEVEDIAALDKVRNFLGRLAHKDDHF